MTIAVDWDVKKQNQNQIIFIKKVILPRSHLGQHFPGGVMGLRHFAIGQNGGSQ